MQTSHLAQADCREMWVWSVASPPWERDYPPCAQCGIIFCPKIIKPRPTIERLSSVRGDVIRHSRAFVFHFRPQIMTFQRSKNGLKPSVVWLGQSVLLRDSWSWKMRSPPWDHSWNCESHGGTVRVERSELWTSSMVSFLVVWREIDWSCHGYNTLLGYGSL